MCVFVMCVCVCDISNYSVCIVAAACKAMGMTVWAVKRSQNSVPSPPVDHFRLTLVAWQPLFSSIFHCHHISCLFFGKFYIHR